MDLRKNVPECTAVVMNSNSRASNGGSLFIEKIICQIRSESATSASSMLFTNAYCAFLVVMAVVKKSGGKRATCYSLLKKLTAI